MILVVNNCVNAECKPENGNNTELLKAGNVLYSGFVANSRYKIQVLSKTQTAFSSTKIIDKKPYP